MSKATFVEQGVDPAAPAAGRVTLYAKNNFLFSIDDVGTTTPLTGGEADPTGYINGLDIDFTSVSTITINPGSTRSTDDEFDIDVGSTILIDITTSGVNGLDTGVESANAWYAIHVIDDSNAVNAPAGLFSLLQASPIIPGGYDKFRHIGWVRNHTGDFLNFISFGVGRSRFVFWAEDRNQPPQRVLSGGGATGFTNVDLAIVVPPQGAGAALLNLQQSSASIGSRLRAAGNTDPGGTIFCRQGNSMQAFLENVNQAIEYSNVSGPGGSLTVDVVGFSLPL